MATQHIVALGGGGFSMEDSTLLDDYILSLSRNPTPRVCFLPTASGDNENYIVRFYRRFTSRKCVPCHLELFRRTIANLDQFLADQDVVYVGGGNTANMLAVWRLHGVDVALRNALEHGSVLAGVSAGSICWFDTGVTDSFGGELATIPGLGFISGSSCPHYDGEHKRRPAYHRLIREGLASGLAVDDGAAVHFKDEARHNVVSSRENARAYRVQLEQDVVTEHELETTFLGATGPV